LHIDSANKNFGRTSLRHKASSICNSLPAELKEPCSVNQLKLKLIFLDYCIMCCL